MPDWKNIARLSDKDAKTREAQFEAEMQALVAQGNPQPPAAAPAPPVKISPVPPVRTSSPPIAVPLPDGVQIAVTANGQTTQYKNLESVPGEVRQHIMATWIGSPAAAVPPIYSAPAFPSAPPPSQKSKAARLGMFLNLIVPGAGQFYLGQRFIGTVYALSFLATFVGLIAIFVKGYFTYLRLSTSGDVLDAGNLEQIAQAFPAGAIGALAALGTLIYIISAIHLAVSRPRKDV